jgi:hypothetical protein
VPIGTAIVKSVPLRPDLLDWLPAFPESALNWRLKRNSTSVESADVAWM